MKRIILASIILIIIAAASYFTIIYNNKQLSMYVTSGFVDNELLKSTIGALKDTGYRIKIISSDDVDNENALTMLNNGDIDIDSARIAGLEKIYPNIVMVEEPIVGAELIASSINDIDFNNLKSYNIGIIFGHKFAENYTKNFKYVSEYSNYKIALDSLYKKDIDAIIWFFDESVTAGYDKYFEDTFSQKLNHNLYDVLMTAHLYMYVNKKYEYIVEDIAENLSY